MTRLLAYTAIDGIPTFPDSFVRGLFERMQEEDTVHDVFCDGSVTTAEEFLRMMKFGSNQLFVIEFNGKMGGFCWLNGFEHRRAWFHFCFFNALRGKDAVEAGREVIRELLNMESAAGSPMFDLLTGLTPETNTAALRWVRRLGGQILGTLPEAVWDSARGESVSGVISYVERGKYGQ